MTQLFAVGEVAILQSTDAAATMWNARVTVTSAKWMDHPLDIHGMPQPSSFVYEIDLCEGYFVQSALRKIEEANITIKEKIAVEINE